MKIKSTLSIVLCIAMVATVSIFPVTAEAADYSDMPDQGYWSTEALQSAVDNGLLQGINNKLNPKEHLTRAQLAAIINRAFGSTGTTDISGYTDVTSTAWYHEDMGKAVQMKTFLGDGTGKLKPQDNVSRQEAFAVLARAFKLGEGKITALDKFSDINNISSWAVDSLAKMAEAGYLKGTEGKLNPQQNITREEFAQIMHNMLSSYITTSGTYTTVGTGNVMIKVKDVTLKNLTIKGDLMIGEGVGSGDVTLDNVAVTGRIVVRGGGENSIHIKNNSDVGNIVIGKTDGGAVRIVAEKGCEVEMVYVDDGKDDVIMEGAFTAVSVESKVPVVLKNAEVGALTVASQAANLTVLSGKIASVDIKAESANTTVKVESGAKIESVTTASEKTKVMGSGDVGKVTALAGSANVSVDTKGTEVKAEAGAIGTTAGGKDVTAGSSVKTDGNAAVGGSGGGSGGGNGGGSHYYTATVSTLTELNTALNDSYANNIIIGSNIMLPTGTAILISSGKTVTNNAAFTISEHGDLAVEGALVNNGIINVKGYSATTTDCAVFVARNGGVVTNNGTINVKAATTADGDDSCPLGGMLRLNGGTLNNASGAAVTFEAGDVNRDGGFGAIVNGTFNNSGTVNYGGLDFLVGQDNNVGYFLNKQGATLNINGQFHINNGGLSNWGRIVTNGAGDIFIGPDCDLNIYTGGTIEGAGTIDALAVGSNPTADSLAEGLGSGYYGKFAFGKFDKITMVKDLEIGTGLTLDINTGKELVITNGNKLTVTEGAILNLHGTLTVNNGGELGDYYAVNVYGTLNNNGSTYVAPDSDMDIYTGGAVTGVGTMAALTRGSDPVMAGLTGGYYGKFAFGRHNTITLLKDIEIKDDVLKISAGQKLIVSNGVKLTVASGAGITVNGSIEVNGTLANNGMIDGSGTISGNYTYSGH